MFKFCTPQGKMLILLTSIFYSDLSQADTVITAKDQNYYTVNIKGSKSVRDIWASGDKESQFKIWITLYTAARSCEISGMNIVVKHRTTDVAWEQSKSYTIDGANSQRVAAMEWYAASQYLASSRLDGVEVSADVRCRAPMDAEYIYIGARMGNTRGSYVMSDFFMPSRELPALNRAVQVSVSDTVDFGTLYDTSPTEWHGLWRGTTPEHAKIMVDNHVLAGPGSAGFSVDDPLGRIDFLQDGWIRFIPNGRPGKLSRYFDVRIEYQ